ncbi:hypothetical protein CFE70_004158 [Pyrenophora teres f. teres 0-1]
MAQGLSRTSKRDYCDTVSFKFNCPNNSVLPLTKEHRRKMNELTSLFNEKIKSIIDKGPTHPNLYVNVNDKFNDNRFCEQDVQEPSYRNPNIWFHPLEYSTGDTSILYDGRDKVLSGDCQTLLNNFGDQGEVVACLISNGVQADNTALDLNTVPNNFGDAPVVVQYNLPAWLARVFHPNINAMTAYRDAIVEAYKAYSSREVETSSLPVFTFDPIVTMTIQVPDATTSVSAPAEAPSTMTTMSV